MLRSEPLECGGSVPDGFATSEGAPLLAQPGSAAAALQAQPTVAAEALHRRHDLVWLSAGSAVEAGPWVVAARSPADLQAGLLRLGRCTPQAGARALRHRHLAAATDVHLHRPPLAVREALALGRHLPESWRCTLRRLEYLAARFDLSIRIYGSLAWHLLHAPATADGDPAYLGPAVPPIAFLHPGSDLDLLLEPAAPLSAATLAGLLAALAELTRWSVAHGGPALDGEVRLEGAGDVSWRELLAALAQPTTRVLVKTTSTVALADPAQLVGAAAERARARDRPAPAALDALACAALRAEVHAWPKPGLVSPVDGGSHSDMDIALLRAAIDALQGWFGELARAAQAGAGFAQLAAIGRAAEHCMLQATGQVNAYRGAIFNLGLLVAAVAVCPPDMRPGTWVQAVWGAELRHHRVPDTTHGALIRRREGAGGALAEAAAGFPQVEQVLLPALRAARARGFSAERAAVAALLAGIATLEDSNLLWRGGRAGLQWAQAQASAALRRDLPGRGDWRRALLPLHRDFVARRLSPGGSADLLACALFLQALETERR